MVTTTTALVFHRGQDKTAQVLQVVFIISHESTIHMFKDLMNRL